MSVLNAGLTFVADVVLAPFSTLPPLVGLSIVSLVTAAAMLAVFKRTSDQARLAAVKRSIHAALFEIRLFNDDLRAIVRAQIEILRHNATYLRLSLVPMVWVIVPLVLVIAQLQFYYGYAPLQPGDGVLLKVQLREGAAGAISSSTALGSTALGSTALGSTVRSDTVLSNTVSLEAPPQVKVDTPAVWLPAAKEVVWRVRPAAAGRYDVFVTVGTERYTKSVQIAGGAVRRSPVRLENSFMNQLLYPSEPPLPADGPVSAITVGYAEHDMAVFGWSLHWMIVYVALSLIFAFALRKPFGVTI